MVDTLTPAERSERMGRVRGKDTKPEMKVRRLVHGMGYRYRLHRRDLPGCPDLVFPRLRKAIFVHGCFWHRHPDPECKLARLPKSRLDFWWPKLEGNRRRDEANQAALLALGWRFLVIWECETKKTQYLVIKIKNFLEEDE
ncbi:very short patch repair endonuclease [Methylocaldum szegediense]|uniref:Very short patch repair endonuclease n=1 Tax=Methylocaldum szegediense TaxID=73780 RepID=A0ABM9I9W2_9GAMM|nr:very short patch repair endonuclease [Methylocaldum szegediense]CAI8982712.1 XorII very short patch repair endonuclease [Methylocaldum szegediense]